MSKAPDVEFTRLFPTAHFSDQELLRSTKPLQGGAAAAGQGVVVSTQWRRYGPPNSLCDESGRPVRAILADAQSYGRASAGSG